MGKRVAPGGLGRPEKEKIERELHAKEVFYAKKK